MLGFTAINSRMIAKVDVAVILLAMVNRFLLILLMLVFTNTAFAMVPAKRCASLSCVRRSIDSVDQKIVLLLKKRLDYVKRAGELKKHIKSVHDQKRENQILAMVARQAKLAGYPGYIAAAVFKTILIQSNQYEKRFHHYR